MLISRIRKPCGGVVVVVIAIALLVGGVGAGSASAAETSDVSSLEAATKRDALLKMRDETLEDFYATKPEIKEELTKAVGYAVFDASQVNIVLFVGGAGGGMLVENGTGKSREAG